MKHPSELDINYKCRIYGKAHGYSGLLGGWIYYGNGPVCQGWVNFYRIYGKRVEQFMLDRYMSKVKSKSKENKK